MPPEPTSADLGFPVQYVPADASVKGYYSSQYGAMSANAAAERKALEIDWFVVHDTEGYWPSDRDYLQVGHDASARAVIAPDGTVAIMVPLDEIAWTGGSGISNARGVHYEVSGFAKYGYTHEQYKALAALIIHDSGRIPNAPQLRYVGRSGQRGIIAHSDIPNPRPTSHPEYCGAWGGQSCHGDPGSKFDWSKLEGLIQALSQTAPPPPPVEFFPQTGHSMHHSFLAFYQWLRSCQRQGVPGALLLAGYPETDEIVNVPLKAGDPPAAAMQLLERGTLIYEPGNTAPWDVHFAMHWQTVAAIIHALDNGLATPQDLGLKVITAADGTKGLAVL
jgi:N-acetyl-anhydromuramyl-L-alanine amidase AmpD